MKKVFLLVIVVLLLNATMALAYDGCAEENIPSFIKDNCAAGNGVIQCSAQENGQFLIKCVLPSGVTPPPLDKKCPSYSTPEYSYTNNTWKWLCVLNKGEKPNPIAPPMVEDLYEMPERAFWPWLDDLRGLLDYQKVLLCPENGKAHYIETVSAYTEPEWVKTPDLEIDDYHSILTQVDYVVSNNLDLCQAVPIPVSGFKVIRPSIPEGSTDGYARLYIENPQKKAYLMHCPPAGVETVTWSEYLDYRGDGLALMKSINFYRSFRGDPRLFKAGDQFCNKE